jgi:hypothetical protein
VFLYLSKKIAMRTPSFKNKNNMLARFKEFTVVMIQQDTLAADETQWDAAQVAWVSSWANYVQGGGTRPPRKPPL